MICYNKVLCHKPNTERQQPCHMQYILHIHVNHQAMSLLVMPHFEEVEQSACDYQYSQQLSHACSSDQMAVKHLNCGQLVEMVRMLIAIKKAIIADMNRGDSSQR